jgi:signal transduction histidine kinase
LNSSINVFSYISKAQHPLTNSLQMNASKFPARSLWLRHIMLRTCFCLLFFLLPFPCFRLGAQQNTIGAGNDAVLDLRNFDFKDASIPLDGKWTLYWKQLLGPADTGVSPAMVRFPLLWTKTVVNGLPLPSTGYASYKIKIWLPKEHPALAIDIPDFYTSYRLFINGTVFAQSGNPGTSSESTVPRWMPQTAEISGATDTLSLVLQVANFRHSKGGPYKSLVLGDKKLLFQKREIDEAFDLVLTGCWFMGGLFFLGLYFFGRHDKSLLYFALFALTYSYRIIGTRLYVLHSIFPHIPWSVTLHMEYISFFSSIAFFTLYTRHLYPKDSNRYIINILTCLCFVFTGIVIIFPPAVFTLLINPFLVLMVVMIAYGFYIYFMAWRNKRTGSLYAFMSTCVVLLVFVVIILQYFQVITAVKGILFAGYISFFFLQSLILSFRYTHALKQIIEEVEQKRKAIESSNAALKTSMEQLKAAQSQLIQSEKMASLGELTAGIAHEIQNPLNFVNNFAELNTELIDELQAELRSGNNTEALAISNDVKKNEEKINQHGKRADAIVKGMLLHSRNTGAAKEPAELNKITDEYLRLAYHGFRAKDNTFNAILNTGFDESISTVRMAPQEMGRVLVNLYNNAFYAIAEKDKEQKQGYQPTVSISTRKGNGIIEIRIADNGNGIPKSIIDKIYQPFFTTKPTGQGTGLGLSLAYDIVKAHGGELVAETKENEGTAFIVRLPG